MGAVAKTLFSKGAGTGTAIPIADTADAKGTATAMGRLESVVFQVAFAKGGGNDLRVGFEAKQDGSVWAQVASRRLDLDTVATPLHTFTATGVFFVVVERAHHFVSMRPVVFMSAGPHADDGATVKVLERE